MPDVSTMKLEIVELDQDAREKWYDLACEVRELHNYVWRQWEAWHTIAGSDKLLREDLHRYNTWKAKPKKQRGPQPKFRVECWPKEFANQLYHASVKRFPKLNSRCITLALQKIRGNIVGKKSIAVPSIKWWQAIMLDRDTRAVTKRPMPIPFDKANCTVRPCDKKGRIWLEVRVDRQEIAGKKNAKSTLHRFALKTGGKRWWYAKRAHDLAAGKVPLRGSDLYYDAHLKKWFACLTTDAPEVEKPEVDPSRVAILRPGRKANWRLRINGRTISVAGRGHHVANVRKGLLLQRWSRQEGYRNAPPRKGRGKNNALQPLFKLQRRWHNFTKRLNDSLVAFTTEFMAEHGVGTLVLVGGDSERRLATAGKIEGRRDSTGWPWYQVEKLFEQKCQKLGIAVKKRSFCGGKYRRKLVQQNGLARNQVETAAK